MTSLMVIDRCGTSLYKDIEISNIERMIQRIHETESKFRILNITVHIDQISTPSAATDMSVGPSHSTSSLKPLDFLKSSSGHQDGYRASSSSSRPLSPRSTTTTNTTATSGTSTPLHRTSSTSDESDNGSDSRFSRKRHSPYLPLLSSSRNHDSTSGVCSGPPKRLRPESNVPPPTDRDIICGIRASHNINEGNNIFKDKTRHYYESEYKVLSLNGETKKKTKLIKKILREFREKNHRFMIENNNGHWEELDEKKAHSKVSQKFRDLRSEDKKLESTTIEPLISKQLIGNRNDKNMALSSLTSKQISPKYEETCQQGENHRDNYLPSAPSVQHNINHSKESDEDLLNHSVEGIDSALLKLDNAALSGFFVDRFNMTIYIEKSLTLAETKLLSSSSYPQQIISSSIATYWYTNIIAEYAQNYANAHDSERNRIVHEILRAIENNFYHMTYLLVPKEIAFEVTEEEEKRRAIVYSLLSPQRLPHSNGGNDGDDDGDDDDDDGDNDGDNEGPSSNDKEFDGGYGPKNSDYQHDDYNDTSDTSDAGGGRKGNSGTAGGVESCFKSRHLSIDFKNRCYITQSTDRQIPPTKICPKYTNRDVLIGRPSHPGTIFFTRFIESLSDEYHNSGVDDEEDSSSLVTSVFKKCETVFNECEEEIDNSYIGTQEGNKSKDTHQISIQQSLDISDNEVKQINLTDGKDDQLMSMKEKMQLTSLDSDKSTRKEQDSLSNEPLTAQRWYPEKTINQITSLCDYPKRDEKQRSFGTTHVGGGREIDHSESVLNKDKDDDDNDNDVSLRDLRLDFMNSSMPSLFKVSNDSMTEEQQEDSNVDIKPAGPVFLRDILKDTLMKSPFENSDDESIKQGSPENQIDNKGDNDKNHEKQNPLKTANVDSHKTTSSSTLEADSDRDIYLGRARGHSIANREGNRYHRKLIKARKVEYQEANTRKERFAVANEIIQEIKNDHRRFMVSKDSGEWEEADGNYVLMRVKQALREKDKQIYSKKAQRMAEFETKKMDDIGFLSSTALIEEKEDNFFDIQSLMQMSLNSAKVSIVSPVPDGKDDEGERNNGIPPVKSIFADDIVSVSSFVSLEL